MTNLAGNLNRTATEQGNRVAVRLDDQISGPDALDLSSITVHRFGGGG